MADPNDIFGRMFASFVNRKIRGHRNRPPPPPVPQEPLRRATSEYRSSRSRPRGIAGLLSPSSSRTPTNRSGSSSQHRAGSSTAAAAASAAASHLGYSGSNVPMHHPQQEYDAGGHADHAASRRHSARYSEKTISDDDRPPRKRSRTHHIVRSQSAHSVGNRNSRRNAAETIAPRPAHIPRTRPAPTTRSFPCAQCDAVFQQRGQLARHTRRVHEKLRPYECEHCGRLFGARSDRTRHIQIIHNKVRDFSCQQCGYKFQAKAHLENHVRAKHMSSFVE